MKTKRYIYTIAASLLAGALSLTSCNDYLDEMPDNRATINTDAKVAALLVSAYPTGLYSYMTEMYSDNVDRQLKSTYTAYQTLDEEAALWRDITFDRETYDSPYAVWDAHYAAIAAANEALAAIDEMGNPESLKGERGEALMCRAYAHWVLVNIFCKNYSYKTSTTDLGIPYMTEPETTLKAEYQRGTVAEVYANIDRDIQEALPLLDDAHISIPKYHFTKKASYAFAARFYLFYMQPDKSNLDKVIKYSSEVLTATPAAVIRDWATLGKKAVNNEVRAMAYVDATDNANLLIISTYSVWDRVHGATRVGYKYCHDEVIADNETVAANPWGAKKTLNFSIPTYASMPKVIMAKMAEYFEYTDATAGIGYPHIMFAALTTDECLLNRAEAYILKGEYDLGADDLNTWGTNFYSSSSNKTADEIASFYATKSFYTPMAPTVKKKINPDFTVEEGKMENMIYACLACRRVLMLHEGFRLFDVKRYGIEITRRGILSGAVTEIIDELKKDDPRRAIQLPQTVIAAGMEANPR